MKTSLSLMASFVFCCSYGQNKTGCEILNALLKHSEAKKVFYFDKHKDVPIVLVDVNNYFGDCTIDDFYGRNVQIVHDSSYLSQTNYSNLIVNHISQPGNKYKISIYYKVRNAIFQMSFKKSNGKITVTSFHGGYY